MEPTWSWQQRYFVAGRTTMESSDPPWSQRSDWLAYLPIERMNCWLLSETSSRDGSLMGGNVRGETNLIRRRGCRTTNQITGIQGLRQQSETTTRLSQKDSKASWMVARVPLERSIGISWRAIVSWQVQMPISWWWNPFKRGPRAWRRSNLV